MTPRPVVLVAAPIHADGLDTLAGVDLRVHHYDKALPDGGVPADVMAVAEGVIVRGMPVTRALLERAPQLRVVAKHGAGVNTIDLAACAERGIVVTNTGNANGLAVAQLAVTLMLAAQRLVPAVYGSLIAGDYNRFRTTIFPDLLHRTVGVVGLGAIGQAAARMLAGGFDAKLLGFDPGMDATAMAAMGVTKVDDLDTLLRQSDAVTLHLPLLPATRHLISRARLRLMQPHAVLVNTARGGIIDEAALHEALTEGWIWAAGLDAFEEEPLFTSPLFALPNVVLSPHVGGATEGSRKLTAVRAATAVLDVLAGRAAEFIVPLPKTT